MRIPATLLTACAVLFFAANVQQAHHSHWSYSGAEGPTHWAQLDHSYAICSAGHAQSPVDIKDAKIAALPALQFDYRAAPQNIVNNGHTIQVSYAPGNTLRVGDKTYTLKQFHFHHPSEEAIAGRHFDLVAHLVHDDGSGHLAVVAVLFTTGAANPVLETVWKNMPRESGKTVDLAGTTLQLADLLPSDRGYYTYSGSLTTPPCSEGVTWYVLKTPVTLSSEQLAAFAKLYPHNARPTQPLSGRVVQQTN
ncbi:MAG TPA: carbonic anhydrase family protein [Gemmatimonadales bacterium]|nr:carbonic anhydrase family protein [Gemmatimonadales bacterium]